MKIDITSLCFGFKIKKDNDSGTAAWATSIGQAPKDICYIDTKREGLDEIIFGMMYKTHSDFENLQVRDIPGIEKKEEPRGDRERMLFSVFEDVYVNNMKVNGIYTLSYEREDTSSHKNRLHICYAKYLTYKGHSNKMTLIEMAKTLGCKEDACWFVSDISIKKQQELHFSAIVVNPDHEMAYVDSKTRKKEWESMLPEKDETSIIIQDITHQQIFYGAPGTGKSHTINKTTEQQPKENVFRTTFHPDSDYSTFVGCYKPSMTNIEPIYKTGELINRLSEIKTSGVTYPCHKFAAKYWESLKDLSSDEIKKILTDCGFTETMNVEISKGVAVGEDLAKNADSNKIVYSFAPQSFTKAYLRAWQTEDPVFLVIEEINRGNCAQIFGDLFQLLDRKEGMSEYPIKADCDLSKFIAENLSDSKRTDIPESVKKGEELMLPANLFIWATMNTSDQSLFPIDSAFKRRWDWKYIPIADAKKNYVIEVDNDQYDWWSFLDIINDIIEDSTHSEDKKLGYFFAKATNDGKISAETFVNKVIFYLWNDVFKDNESGHKAFKDENGDMLAFHRFFHDDGSINTDMVIQFLQDLEVDPYEYSDDGSAQQTIVMPNAKRERDKSRYRVNTTDNLNKAQMTREAFKSYIESHPDADAKAISQAWNGLGLKGIVQHLVETEEEYNERTKDSQDPNKRAVEYTLANEEKIYLSTQFGIGNIDKFVDAVNNAGWNIRIDKMADKK